MATQHTADAYDKYRQTIQPGQRALSRTKWSAQNAAPAAPATPTVLPDSTAPEGFNYGETLKNVAQEASKLNQQKQLDQRFEALGLGNLKGSQIDASFMGKLISGFKDAKDRGVLQHLGYEERKREAEQEAKTAATETAYKHFEDLGPILADVEPSKLQSMIAGSNIDYKTALLYQKKAEYDKKLSETKNEEEKIQLAKEMELMDLEISQAKKDLSGVETPAEKAARENKEANTAATIAETEDKYGTGQVIYDEPIVETGIKSVLGGNVKLKTTVALALDSAMLDLDKKGIEIKIADSYVPYGVKQAAYIAGKDGNVSGADSFHTKGQAIDLSQLSVDEMNSDVVFNSLKRAGFQQHPGEWWHWSMGEFGTKKPKGDESKAGQAHKDRASKAGITLPKTQGEYNWLQKSVSVNDITVDKGREQINNDIITNFEDTASIYNTEEGTFDNGVADLNTFAEMLSGIKNLKPKEIIDDLNSAGDISYYFFKDGVDKNSAENFANFLTTAGYTDEDISETFDGMDTFIGDTFKEQFGAEFNFGYKDGEVVEQLF